MLAKLKLALLSGLLALLISGKFLILGLLEKLLVLVVDGSLALKREAAAFLSNTGGDRANAVAKHVVTLLLGSLELFLDVALSYGRRLRICLETFLDLRGLTLR